MKKGIFQYADVIIIEDKISISENTRNNAIRTDGTLLWPQRAPLISLKVSIKYVDYHFERSIEKFKKQYNRTGRIKFDHYPFGKHLVSDGPSTLSDKQKEYIARIEQERGIKIHDCSGMIQDNSLRFKSLEEFLFFLKSDFGQRTSLGRTVTMMSEMKNDLMFVESFLNQVTVEQTI
jgi:hypothetical protein